MNNQAMTAQLERIEREVRSVRSLLISVVGKDQEGKYNPEFVQAIQASSSELPTHTFKSSKTFLQELQDA